MFSCLTSSPHTHALFKSIKIILFATTIAVIFLPDDSIAQKQDSSSKGSPTLSNKFEIGLVGGFSLNRFTKDQPQTGLNTGYSASLSVNYNLYKNLGIRIETNFLQQGGQMIRFKDDTRIDLPESFETKNVKNSSYLLNSVEVPLLINYTFKIKQSWVPVLYAGASYAYTFNVTEHYQKTGDLLPGEDIIATVNGTQNATNQFNQSRFNLTAGASVKLPLYSRLMLLLDFRYLTGLTAARENYSYMEKVGFGSDVRTNSFLSRIGIILPIIKTKKSLQSHKQK